MRKILDLAGKRFGRLTVVEKTDFRKGTSVVWRCRCDCGNEVFLSSKNLVHNRTLSCGCKRREEATKTLAQIARPLAGLVDHTNLSKLASTKAQRNSNTGVRGVTRLPDGRYEAYIHLRGKRFRIGRYYTLEEAHAERERAVDKYFRPLLDKWEQEKKQRKGQK